MLELPTDRPRSRERAWGGAALRFRCRPISALVYRFSQQRNATLFMTLLTAFEILLHRYSGQDTLLVGTPIANRNRSEIEGLIGFFVNTLVLRTDLGGEPTVEDLLGRVRTASLAAHDHQDVPFERLVEELQSERDLSRSPLFQAFFVLQNTPASAADLPDLEPFTPSGGDPFGQVRPQPATGGGLERPVRPLRILHRPVRPSDHRSHGRALFAPPRGDGGFAGPGDRASAPPGSGGAAAGYRRMERHGSRLRHGGLPPCVGGGAGRADCQRPSRWSSGPSSSPRELDRRPAVARPPSPYSGRWSRGAGGSRRPASFELIIGLLAVLKAGGAYVPLDPGYPEERLAFMIEDSGVPVLLTQEPLAERLGRLSPGDIHQVLLDSDVAEDDDAEPLVTGVGPDHGAYAIYTSGSTGRPKGVVNTHRGIVNHMLWMQQVYELTASDRVLQKTPYSFDASIWEIFSPLDRRSPPGPGRARRGTDSRYLVDAVERLRYYHAAARPLDVFGLSGGGGGDGGLPQPAASLLRR